MRRVEIKNAVLIYHPSLYWPLPRKPPRLRTPRQATVYRVVPRRLDSKPADEA